MTTNPSIDPDVVLYATVDSLRADAVEPETMPYLADVGERGIQFDQMISTAPATAASFVGLQASRYYCDVEGIGLPESEFTTLAEGVPRRYRCVGHSANQFTSAFYNYNRGFDSFAGESQDIKFKIREALNEDGLLFRSLEWAYHQYLKLQADGGTGNPSNFNTPAGAVNDALLAARSRPREQEFLWAHYMDPHHPLEPPEEYLPDSVESRGAAQDLTRSLAGKVDAKQRDDIRRVDELYQAECRHWDDAFREIHQHLPDDTLTVVVGDHGELIGEYSRYGHPHELWDELLRVPCIIHHPSLPSDDIAAQQSTIDLAPTILDLLGADVPASMRGYPIPLEAPVRRDQCVATIETPEHVAGVRTPEWKWMRHESRRSTQDNHGELLFRTGTEGSPARGRELAEENPDRVHDLRGAFSSAIETEARPSGQQADSAQVRKHLADLGYLEQR